MISIARKNLFQEKTRFLISIGGVAFSVLLILVILGLFQGWSGMIKKYVENFQGDIWVAQSGTSDLFHSTTILPESLEDEIKEIKGVERVNIYRGRATVIDINGQEAYMFLVGYSPHEQIGGPVRMIKGERSIKTGEIIIDRVFAKKNKLDIGDNLSIEGKFFNVKGISEGGDMVMYQSHFITQQDAAELLGLHDKVNFFLVIIDKSEEVISVANRIENKLSGLKVFSEQDFVEKNNRVIVKSFLPIIFVLVIIGFLIGVIVIGLTIYTATTEKTREYGILKAIGAKNSYLYQIIFQQALISGCIGYLVGVILTIIAIQVAKYFVPEFVTQLRLIDAVWVLLASLGMSILASYIPVRKISQIDPALVFKT